jgi:hypothetical protein
MNSPLLEEINPGLEELLYSYNFIEELNVLLDKRDLQDDLLIDQLIEKTILATSDSELKKKPRDEEYLRFSLYQITIKKCLASLSRHDLLDKEYYDKLLDRFLELQFKPEASHYSRTTVGGQISKSLNKLIKSKLITIEQGNTILVDHKWRPENLTQIDFKSDLKKFFNNHYQELLKDGSKKNEIKLKEPQLFAIQNNLFSSVWPTIVNDLNTQIDQRIKKITLLLSPQEKQLIKEIINNVSKPEYSVPEMDNNFPIFPINITAEN